MDPAELVAALKNPAFYEPPVERVELVQTHISWVFLTGERAYKLKKPVNFGFLDFSSLELRERYCRAEVELNRRLAPEVYLGVAPITLDGEGLRLGGSGTVVDWVVVMDQLDADRLGVAMLERGELSERHLEQLVDVLVPFYDSARRGPEVDRFGSVDALRHNTDENFAQTASVVGKLIARERWQRLRDWNEAFYEASSELIRHRVDEGWIREGHGDLRLSNIFFEASPQVLDCIEFSDRLRCCDPAADLAFLAMDLDYRGRSDLAGALIERYVAAASDPGLPAVLAYYKCYRAVVRAKVAAFAAADPGFDHTTRRRLRNEARHYFGLAYRYTGGTQRPPLVVVYGLMGTGKSSIAHGLRERLGWHVLSTDAVRKQLAGLGEYARVFVPYGEGLYSAEMNRSVYAEVCRRAENLLQAGLPVVVDGSFKRVEERLALVELAERVGARLLLLEAACGGEEQRRRLEARRRHDTRSDGRVELLGHQHSEFESPSPEHLAFSVRVATDGTAAAVQARVIGELQTYGLLD